MVFLGNVSNRAVLESELARLKALYAQALERKNEVTIKALRKTIKSIKAKMNRISDVATEP